MRFAKIARIPLVGVISIVAFACAAEAVGQSPTPPPIKMGLWETTTTSTVSGMQIPPEVAERLKAMGRSVPGGPHTSVVHACYTPESWAKAIETMHNRADTNCKTSHWTQEEHKVTFDEDCSSPQGAIMTGHVEYFFEDSEHTHGSVHMKMDTSAAGPSGQPMEISVSLKGHYLGADLWRRET